MGGRNTTHSLDRMNDIFIECSRINSSDRLRYFLPSAMLESGLQHDLGEDLYRKSDTEFQFVVTDFITFDEYNNILSYLNSNGIQFKAMVEVIEYKSLSTSTKFDYKIIEVKASFYFKASQAAATIKLFT